ncbi:TadE/TadG family type IV pilus assembly protein [Kallipyga massiliensis]|uniref:TadE/TadG family type IV pilus assembly protein n=1 Tax=Kallipyga massiliensis TaxID=1472764 RepID=UPI0004B1DAFA|nr:hypothetical protein [Kallipyga massiliensis]
MKNKLLLRRGRREEGSLTIEAALIMGIMVIFITGWILILHLLKIQAYTQHALDQTALNLSDDLSMVHSLREGVNQIGNYLKDTVDLRPPEALKGLDMGGIEDLALKGSSQLAFSKALKGGGEKLSPAISQWMGDPVLETTIDDDQDIIQLKLTYEIRLPGPLQAFGPKIVHQNVETGIWLLTDEPVVGIWDEDDRNKKKEESIWKESNFSRGRKFAEKYRKQSAQPLPPGQGIDFIDSGGKGVAIYSLNIFSDHYSLGKGMDPSGYQLKKDGLEKKLISYLRKTKRDIGKVNSGQGGKETVKSGGLLIIVPEEAKVFSADLEVLGQDLERKEGLSVDFIYDQKALVEGGKDD